MTGSPPPPQPRAAWGISRKGSGSGHYVDTSGQHTLLQHQRVPPAEASVPARSQHLRPHPHPGRRASCSLHGTLTRTGTLTGDLRKAWTHSCSGRLPVGCFTRPAPPRLLLRSPFRGRPCSGLCTLSPAWGAALPLDPHSTPCTLRAGTLSPQLPPPIATCSISLYTDCWEPSDPTPVHSQRRS